MHQQAREVIVLGYLERTAKTLIRLGAQPHCWFCHVAAHVQAIQQDSSQKLTTYRYVLNLRITFVQWNNSDEAS